MTPPRDPGHLGPAPQHEQADLPALADREAVLASLTRVIADAWASFDAPRAGRARPGSGAGRAARLRPARPAGRRRVRARRRRARARRERLPLAPALPRLHRLERPGDGRARLRARRHLRREPRHVGRRRRPHRGAGAALGRRLRRLPARRGRVHQRRHDVQPHRPARRARARAARRAPRRRRRPRAPRSTAPTRRTTRSCAPSRRAGWARAPCAASRSTARAAWTRPRWREALARDAAAGVVPVAVVATAGTTLTGAVDPIGAIADACAEHGVWLHVDGAYGLPGGRRAVGRRAVRRAGARRLRHARRAQVARRAEELQRRAAARGRAGSRRRSATRSATCSTRATSPTRSTARSSTRARCARCGCGWRSARTAPRSTARGSRARSPTPGGSRSSWRDAPHFELLHEPMLSTVCFRHAPPGVEDLDAHNVRLARAMQRDGRIFLAPRRGRRPRVPARVLRELPHHAGRGAARARGGRGARRPLARQQAGVDHERRAGHVAGPLGDEVATASATS